MSDEDFDGADDGESKTSYNKASEEDCCDSEEVQLFRRLTDGVEAGLCQLATDCLRVGLFCYSFVVFIIWLRVCR